MTEATGESVTAQPSMAEERIPLPDHDAMTAEQREMADSLVRGPRKGVVGPYIPLMQTPRLLALMEPLGSELRFHGRLDARIRELVICAVARHTSNQFEWTVHVPLAVDAGVSRDALAAVLNGRSPRDLRDDEDRALKFAQCLMEQHGVPDSLFADAQATFGDEGVIELTTLIGYFATVCWIMNVAHTPSPANAESGIIPPLA